MTADEKINACLPLVDFLADTLGEHCEVVLHDLRKLENSIVALRNSAVTGREKGGTITDYGLQILRHSDDYRDVNYLANYTGKTADGRKSLRSSTYFIKDEGRIIGMLCVNIDETPLLRAKEAIDSLLLLPRGAQNAPAAQEPTREGREEHFIPNIKELMKSVIGGALGDVEASRLSLEEKKQAVERLESSGVFLLKGAVAEVAALLDVSEQTVYRYLKENETQNKKGG